MRNDVPAIAPFLRSESQARLLAEVLLSDDEWTLGDLAQSSGVALPTVQREVDRLAEAGIVLTRKVGRNRLVRPSPDYPLRAPLTQIIAATFGPAVLIREAFASLAGVEHVVIFGSWVARMEGGPGPFPGDVDVLLVGHADRLEAYEAAEELSEEIGREVQVTLMDPSQWEQGDDGLVRDIKSKPLLEVA